MFLVIHSTPRLLYGTHVSRPVEMDDTYKVIHEGYNVTVIEKSDTDRVFHDRWAGDG